MVKSARPERRVKSENQAMSDLLVSFCHAFPRGLGLGAYRFDTGSFRWLEPAGVAPRLNGVCGICRAGSYWVLPQLGEGTSALAELDLELQPKRTHPLQKTRDAHSLVESEGGFLVTDTAANRLNLVHVCHDGRVHEEEVWRAEQPDEDRVHLNGVGRLGSEVYVSLFGPRPEAGWFHARGGKIVNVTRNQVVCNDLFHPHTLVAHEGSLYWLESRRGRVHRYSPSGGHEVLLELRGYLRGLTFDEQFMYVAASALRRRSRSTGVMNTHPSASADDWHSWIYRVDCTSLAATRRRMTAFGGEIYDLMWAGPSAAETGCPDRDQAVVSRIWKYEDAYRDLEANGRQWRQSLQRQNADLQQQVGILETRVSDSQEQLTQSQEEISHLKGELRRVHNCRRWRWAGRILRPFEQLGLLPLRQTR